MKKYILLLISILLLTTCGSLKYRKRTNTKQDTELIKQIVDKSVMTHITSILSTLDLNQERTKITKKYKRDSVGNSFLESETREKINTKAKLIKQRTDSVNNKANIKSDVKLKLKKTEQKEVEANAKPFTWYLLFGGIAIVLFFLLSKFIRYRKKLSL